MVTWPGDPLVQVQPRRRIAQGDACNVSELSFGSHTGTHVDPPYHFDEAGIRLDQLPLDALVGETWVLDCGSSQDIGAADLERGVPAGTERLLLKTTNSGLWERGAREFMPHFAAPTLDAARWIAGHRVRLLGVDYLSVERPGSQDHPVHHALLDSGVIIVEGLDLSPLHTGWYNLVCLPLKVADGDGAPARVIAIGPKTKHGGTEDTERS
jgi:arylformamidase